MNNNFLNYILNAKSAKEWKVYKYGIGDDFESIINDNPSYTNNQNIKSFKRVLFYRSEDSNTVKGIFLPIPFFENQQKKILKEIRKKFGKPYFEHLKMEDHMLYYSSFDFIVHIIKDNALNGICISIGDCGARLQTFNPNNIIDIYIELVTQNLRIHELEKEKDISKYIRLKIKAFKSLLLAFTGKNDLKRFENGRFILESNDYYLNTLMKELESIEIRKSYKSFDSSTLKNPTKNDVYNYWSMLFRYYVNSIRYLQQSSDFNYFKWKKNELENFKIIKPSIEVKAQIASLKKLLCLLIDPDKKNLDIKRMIEEFGYPKEDLLWIESNKY